MENTKISVQDLNLHYGTNHALKHVNMEIRENAITAFIGPSGCGKSTFLKCLNRMNDLVENVKIEGYLQSEGRYHTASKKSGYGISAGKSIPDEHL